VGVRPLPLAKAPRTPEQKEALRHLDQTIDPQIKILRRPVEAYLRGLRADPLLRDYAERLWVSGSVPQELRLWSERTYTDLWHRYLSGPVRDVARDAETRIGIGVNIAPQIEAERRAEFPVFMSASQATAWRIARREAKDRGIENSEGVELMIALAGLSRDGVLTVIASQAQQEEFNKSLEISSEHLRMMQKVNLRRGVLRHIGKLLARRATKTAEFEMAQAYNKAKRLAVVQGMKIGLVKEVERTWITALDDKVCNICEPLHGRTIKASSWRTLYNAWDREKGIQTPPAHIKCRCTEIYRTVMIGQRS
jgi:Phage Mu protein F like protein